MPDRTINFGESETEATYQIQDTDGAAGGGNFVVAKDTNANTVLLEYQPASDTWEYAGDVDMNGGNVSGVGTLTANSVNTGDLDIDSSDFVDSGDFIPLASFGPVAARTGASTTDQSTYQSDNDWHQAGLDFDLITPTNAQTAVYCYLGQSGPENIDGRLRNTSDDETIIEQTNVSEISEIINYTPASTGRVFIEWQYRSADGSSIEPRDPFFAVGVQL